MPPEKQSSTPPKVSIALGTYNGAKFLPEQLESISAQAALPEELVVSDDCSTDETVAIIREFARRAPFPVKLNVNQKNLGSTGNFAEAIALCTGDAIFFVGSGRRLAADENRKNPP